VVPAAHAQVPVRVVNTPLSVTVGNPVTVANPISIANPVTISDPVAIAGPVTVGNTAGSPVQARNVDEPANEPFEFSVCESSGTRVGQCAPGSNNFTVPTTSPTTGAPVKRLVVEYVSGNCIAETGTHLVTVSLVALGGGAEHSFVPVNTGVPGFNAYAFAQQTRLYFSPGANLIGGVLRFNHDQSCIIGASGHFVTQ
jgi:hypothetical protein